MSYDFVHRYVLHTEGEAVDGFKKILQEPANAASPAAPFHRICCETTRGFRICTEIAYIFMSYDEELVRNDSFRGYN